MEVINPIIAGLDVPERTVVGCLRVQEGKRVQRSLRTFGTTTPALLELQGWLVENRCPIVVIESTGVYWKPIFNILEGSVEVILANAHHVKTLPGRKTDMRDAEWLAELGAHGLVKASFIPPEPIRELRELTRYRKSLIRQRTAEVNRIQKILETANIKLGSVASDVLGVSGRAMLRALIAGERDALVLAGLAKGTLRKKMDQLIASLTGRFLQRHAFLLRQMLDHVEFIDSQIATIDGEVERVCVPFDAQLQLLKSAPGIGSRTAQVIVAEIGCDMNQFPTEHHLASWAAICPGNNESAGKRRTGKTRKGNPWLRAALVEAAWAASRARATYPQSQFRHLAYARGKGRKKAIVAVAHSLLIASWHILKKNVPYKDLGPEHLRRTDPEKIKHLLVRKLENLGYSVTLEKQNAA